MARGENGSRGSMGILIEAMCYFGIDMVQVASREGEQRCLLHYNLCANDTVLLPAKRTS